MAEVKITNDNFQSEVMESNIPVLLDFWAIWCGPCKMIAPVVEQIANEYEGKVKGGKINVDEEEILAAAFDISSIPTLVVIKDGKVDGARVGYCQKGDIIKLLDL